MVSHLQSTCWSSNVQQSSYSFIFYWSYEFALWVTSSSASIFSLFVSGLEDGRLDRQHMSGLYGHLSNSSASSSPPAGLGQSSHGQDGGLVVPQPINAKHHGGHHSNGGGGGGSGRKYQCKMCPQVGKVSEDQKTASTYLVRTKQDRVKEVQIPQISNYL